MIIIIIDASCHHYLLFWIVFATGPFYSVKLIIIVVVVSPWDDCPSNKTPLNAN